MGIMWTTLPLTILSFVYGVYCPSTLENEFPSNYPLKSWRSNDPYFEPDLSLPISYALKCSEDDPFQCSLIKFEHSSPTKTYTFERKTVEFISMMDSELTLKVYPKKIQWDITCDFSSLTLAQKFYKLITRDQPQLPFYLKADYLKNLNDIVLAERPNFYLDGFDYDITIVIKNAEGYPVLIFPKNAISDVKQHESTKIDLYIKKNRGPLALYKFGFSTSSQAETLRDIRSKLNRSTYWNFFKRSENNNSD